jgi:hypothetical protein
MNWDIRYPKDMIAKAKEKGKDLFAIGYYGSGRAEACMFLSDEHIALLWIMAHEIGRGASPRDALAAAEARIAAYESRKAEEVPAEEVGGEGLT